MTRREVEQMLTDHQLLCLGLVRNTHWKATVMTPAGYRRIVIFPTSTSDHRALKNKAAQLRNIASGAL